jgi:hypothetical protein
LRIDLSLHIQIMDGDSLIGYLVRLEDGEDGTSYPLAGNRNYIGRTQDCQIRLNNSDVGDRHCMIQVSQLKDVREVSCVLDSFVILS